MPDIRDIDKCFFKLPNFVIDWQMKQLTSSEFKVLMFILRQTIGWQKESDGISRSQFREATGLSPNTIIKATKKLQDKGLVYISRQYEANGMDKYNSYLLSPKFWYHYHKSVELCKNQEEGVQELGTQKTITSKEKTSVPIEVEAEDTDTVTSKPAYQKWAQLSKKENENAK